MSTYVMALYEVDRAYGGPEEGGWYFDTGELRRTLRVFSNQERAFAACRRMNGWLRRIQCGQREVSSVLYSGGRYAAEIYENHAPSYYPQERPHYE